jgi:hypothetical protein
MWEANLSKTQEKDQERVSKIRAERGIVKKEKSVKNWDAPLYLF